METKESAFDMLEKKLNIANSLIEELEIEDTDIILPSTREVVDEYLPSTEVKEVSNEVFPIDTLKTDFVLIRQNVMKYISTGQRILDSISVLDVSDISPALVKSIAELLQALGSNAKLMVDIYKQIVDIEKVRDKTSKQNQPETPQAVNQGTIVNNNILFSGSTDELLDVIKQNQITKN